MRPDRCGKKHTRIRILPPRLQTDSIVVKVTRNPVEVKDHSKSPDKELEFLAVVKEVGLLDAVGTSGILSRGLAVDEFTVDNHSSTAADQEFVLTSTNRDDELHPSVVVIDNVQELRINPGEVHVLTLSLKSDGVLYEPSMCRYHEQNRHQIIDNETYLMASVAFSDKNSHSEKYIRERGSVVFENVSKTAGLAGTKVIGLINTR